MTGDEAPKTLYVGNLSPLVTEELLLTLFGQIGECRSCKIIHEPGNDPYAFIEFAEHAYASAALAAMNKRQCLGKEMKVNWATTSSHQGKVDASNFSEHYHIFVGDLAPEIDQQTLREAFAPFGEISDVKIMKDPHTFAHKGYGFISFVNKVDAETAIASMNGQWLGTRKIRTNWATRKVQPAGGDGVGQQTRHQHVPKLDFNEVWSRSSDNNTTVYCGGINGLTEDLMRNTFAPFGPILAVHPFPDRGYAFVRFASKEAACHAICTINGTDVNGCTAKCSWGKENIDITNTAALSAAVAANQVAAATSTNPAAAASSIYNQANLAAASISQAAAASANTAAANPWAGAGAATNPNWAAAAANYQWAAGYPPNTMNYWQYPGYQSMMQGWGVMPTATTTANSQYQMGQNPQGYNTKS